MFPVGEKIRINELPSSISLTTSGSSIAKGSSTAQESPKTQSSIISGFSVVLVVHPVSNKPPN